MEEHILASVVLIIVAVDAVVLLGILHAVVLIDYVLLIGGKVALIKAYLAIHLKPRFYEAVGQIWVNVILGHINLVGIITGPLAVAELIDGNVEDLAAIVAESVAPLCRVKLHHAVVAAAAHHQLLASSLDLHHIFVGLSLDYEVKRCNVWRHRHISIVGIEYHILAVSHGILRHTVATPASYKQ